MLAVEGLPAKLSSLLGGVHTGLMGVNYQCADPTTLKPAELETLLFLQTIWDTLGFKKIRIFEWVFDLLIKAYRSGLGPHAKISTPLSLIAALSLRDHFMMYRPLIVIDPHGFYNLDNIVKLARW